MKTFLKLIFIQLAIFNFHFKSLAQSNYALNFDGINDCVNIPDNDMLDFGAGHPITVEFWVLRTSNVGGHIFGKRPGCNPVINYQSYSDETGCGFGGSQGIGAGGDPLPLNTWVFFTGSWDGSDTVKYYLNGQLNASSMGVSLIGTVNTASLRIGASGDCASFQGSLDGFRIWNVERTQEQIQSDMCNSPNPANESNLVAYYDFNEGSSTILHDKTLNHLDGTLYNFALTGSASNWVLSNILKPCSSSATIADKSTPEGNTGTKQLKFPVTLSNAYASPVTIKYKTVNNTATAGSDYVAKQGKLTFNAGETKTNISVTINSDTQVEPNERFYVVLSAPVNAVIIDDTAVGIIRNDDDALIAATASNEIKTSTVNNFKVFPNPAKNILYIQISGSAHFTLTDATGKLILTKQINNNSSMNVSKLIAGLYFLRNDITGEVQKIAIQK